MTIAAHLSGKYLGSLLIAAAKAHPEQSYIFFSDKKITRLPENCRTHLISPKPKNRLLLYYWYRYKLPALLIQHNAGLFISDADMLSVKPAIPQYLYVENDGFRKKTNNYFEKIFVSSLQKAEKIFTAEQYFETALTSLYPFTAQKTKTIYHGVLFPAHVSSPEEIKNRITGGVDYFICPVHTAEADQLITLLKAFSLFKKRQKTSMQLVFLLSGRSAEKFLPQLKTYKYEDDVKVIDKPEKDHASVISSAFAMIITEPGRYDHAIFAMQQHIPVVAEMNEMNSSILQDAPLFTELTEASLSAKMQFFYKDEESKAFYGEKGFIFAGRYDTAAVAASLFDDLSS